MGYFKERVQGQEYGPDYEEKVCLFKEKVLWAAEGDNKKINPSWLEFFCNMLRSTSESINFYNDFIAFIHDLEKDSNFDDRQKREAIVKWVNDNIKRFR